MGLYTREFIAVIGSYCTDVAMDRGFGDERLWTSVGGRVTASREVITHDNALKNSAVWCANKLLCGTGASLPLPIYKGRDDDTRVKARKHPAWRLLNIAPNPEQTAVSFRSVMWGWQANWGNAYAEIQREGNVPDGDLVYLWPLHPRRVQPCRDKETDALYYEVRDENGGPSVRLEPWQMFHLPSVLTSDGLMGIGVIDMAMESIGAAIAQEKYGAHWFGGAAVPRAVIEHAGLWTEEARIAFRKEWDEIYSGPTGQRMAVLQGGATIKPISHNANDSQFIETRHLSIEEIARWYGVPPHLLQHLLRATFNNIEELGISFVQYSLISWLRIWEQVISQKLFTPAEQLTHFAEHNVDALLRGDHEARAAFYTAMTAATIMTRNECRKLENLDPVPGGDTFLAQGAMVPLDEDGRPESSFVNPRTPTPQSTDTTSPPDPQTNSVSYRAITKRLERVVNSDLSRFLTKESKAIAGFAKKPDDFVQLVDSFYANHATMVRDGLGDTLGAMSACGLDVNVDVFVATWVGDGKSLALEAAGAAVTAEELTAAVAMTMDSRTWTERPLRAVEGLSECRQSTVTCG